MSYGLGKFNTICINRIASTITSLLGVQPAEGMAPPIAEVLEKADKHFAGANCDRIFMYNPDAIAMWIYGKYEEWMKLAEGGCGKAEDVLKLEMLSVMPSVTPVCFASMYSGLMPEGHGIREYTKPVLKCETIFDILPKAGRKTAIVSTAGDSISLIFLERDVDYFIYETVEECNAKARRLIEEDEYDCIVLYNTDYDHWLHRFGPEGDVTLDALRRNACVYNELRELIAEKWSSHRTALAFAPDHGCHLLENGKGDHGTDTFEDMNIIHLWSFI